MDSIDLNGQEITLPVNAKDAIIDTGSPLVGEWKTNNGWFGGVVLNCLAVVQAGRRRCWT